MRRIEHTLGQAHRAGQLVRIACQFCRITRHFDLMEGDDRDPDGRWPRRGGK